MITRNHRVHVWAIWGLIAVFGILEGVAWTLAGGIPRRPVVLVQVVAAWTVMLILAALATRRIGSLSQRIRVQQHNHEATLGELEQLQTQNAMLEIIARSVDVTLAFQALASRIARLVPCDRVGLALLTESGEEFQTYTARVRDVERRSRPRPEIVFKVEQTLLGNVVRSREAALVGDIAKVATDFLDANLLNSSGFGSVMIVPLVSKGRAVGTLNLVQRAKHAYRPEHAAAIQPIAEIFAVAVIAQQLQVSLGKYRSTEAMSELTLSTAVEMNSALQTIIGLCDLLERGYPDPSLQRDLATVVRQAQRIAGLLESMRAAARERMREVEAAVADRQADIPASPEAFAAEPEPEVSGVAPPRPRDR
ncbi:MAG TPA: GAF domain-containing protein [Vicinamibacterales bacterium]|jgi:signal transduction protein with GAF and PtsI domain